MFTKATKSQSKLRLAIAGPSGSGKTYSALAIACAMTDRVAVVDTEHGSASKYADLFPFDTALLKPPFHPDRFASAIADAEQAGYEVVIIDSLSHAWNGTGGVLELVDAIAARTKGSSAMAWRDVTPVQNRLVETILGSGLHIIVTFRSKTEYVFEQNAAGKTVPRKIGMAPIQRPDIEYEFDVFLDMDMSNRAIVQKTRCPELTGQIIDKPGRILAGILFDWLKGAPLANTLPPIANTLPPIAVGDWVTVRGKHTDKAGTVVGVSDEMITVNIDGQPVTVNVLRIIR